MKIREITRGGLLSASAVALLYLGGAAPWAGAAACVAAGTVSAVPLVRSGRVRMAVMLYLSASALSALVVPRKSLVIIYIGFSGLYPILKYGIEAYIPRRVQIVCKLGYFNLCLFAMGLLAWLGLFPLPAPPLGKLLAAWWAANIVFEFYDMGLSHLIATLRKILPPD